MRDQSQPGIDRRHLLAGGIAAAGVVGLAACGDGTSGATEDPIYGGQQGGAATSTTPSPGTTSAAGATLIALADVPVGGAAAAKGVDGKPIIVAQPQAGTVVAFSAICTHRGCTVAPDAARLKCPCHGSTFAIADGARVSGPAQLPLTKVEVTVVGGQVVSV